MATVVYLYASNSSSQFIPIIAPVTASQSSFLPPSLFGLRPVTAIKMSRKLLPSRPREKASISDERGIYLLKMPIVPKISTEVIIMI